MRLPTQTAANSKVCPCGARFERTWECPSRWEKRRYCSSLCANSHGSHNGRKTHCHRGHPLSGDNLYRPRDGKRRCKQCARRRSWLGRYGLAEAEFDALLIAQAGRCAICDDEMRNPEIDHDHNTEQVRGLLCHRCNMALGIFGDRPELLRSALEYVGGSA